MFQLDVDFNDENNLNMLDKNNIVMSSFPIDIDSIIINNINKILKLYQNEIDEKKYSSALKIVLESKDNIEQEMKFIQSENLTKLHDKILKLISQVYYLMERYEDSIKIDKDVNKFFKNI